MNAQIIGQVVTSPAAAVEPTSVRDCGGALALMYGAPTDWSTVSLQKNGDEDSNAPEVVALLGRIAIEHKLGRILGPRVSDFNSVFTSNKRDFVWQLNLPGTDCKLHRGPFVDGVEIRRGDAGIIAAADCAVIVVSTHTGRVFLLHAGRDSLVDRTLINTGRPSKLISSIIASAWQALTPEERMFSQWHILPSITAGAHFQHRFDDPKWGRSNLHLVSHIKDKYRYLGMCIVGDMELGQICVRSLIKAQLRMYGITSSRIWIDHRCTYKEVDAHGQYVWHSNARGVKEHGDPKARNLFVVINKGL